MLGIQDDETCFMGKTVIQKNKINQEETGMICVSTGSQASGGNPLIAKTGKDNTQDQIGRSVGRYCTWDGMGKNRFKSQASNRVVLGIR